MNKKQQPQLQSSEIPSALKAIFYHPDFNPKRIVNNKKLGSKSSYCKVILYCIIQEMDWKTCTVIRNRKALSNSTGLATATLDRSLKFLKDDEWIKIIGSVDKGLRQQNTYILQLKRLSQIKSKFEPHKWYPYNKKQQSPQQQQPPQQQQQEQQPPQQQDQEQQSPQQQPQPINDSSELKRLKEKFGVGRVFNLTRQSQYGYIIDEIAPRSMKPHEFHEALQLTILQRIEQVEQQQDQ